MPLDRIISILISMGIHTRENVEMDRETTFHIGGKARLMVLPENVQQLSEVLQFFSKENVDYLVLGRCSNILVPDSGIEKAIISTAWLHGITVEDGKIVCLCGETLSSVAEAARKSSLTGLEFAAGIPGSVGGAVYMNAGAYGGEISGTVCNVLFVDSEGEIHNIDVSSSDFSYRHSPFTNKNGCVAQVTFCLKSGNAEEIKKRMTELAKRRSASQPLSKPSAGSVFKRPSGAYAAALIEECGLKGAAVGGASVSEKHAGFIVNNGGATSEDVQKLISYIKEVVREKKGVCLETEIICL